MGISDKRIGELVGKTGLEIRALRKKYDILPSIFQIDTLAAEFPSETNYLYMTYNAQHSDIAPLKDEGVIVLGSGPYRIGSSVEFDWTSVMAVEALKKYHKRAVVINCNPETVSTDYDTSDRLYFEELTFERVADICEFESPHGVIVSVGGQTPNNRAKALQRYGIRLLGNDADQIDQAEDRNRFSKLLDTLGIRQPEWKSLVDQAGLRAVRGTRGLSRAGAAILRAVGQRHARLLYPGGTGAVYPRSRGGRPRISRDGLQVHSRRSKRWSSTPSRSAGRSRPSSSPSISKMPGCIRAMPPLCCRRKR